MPSYDSWKLQSPDQAAGLNYECPACGELMTKDERRYHVCDED